MARTSSSPTARPSRGSGHRAVRGAFEYQGQKCSAASRAYIPKSLWPEVQDRLVATMRKIKMGVPTDFRNFMCAVIDESSFDNAMSYIDFAKASNRFEILAGGKGNKRKGTSSIPRWWCPRMPNRS